ncbi:MAG: sulfatase [Puniceicoccaceae bacterium]
MAEPKPNILLITTDQQHADHLGIAGLLAVPTPNLDRLGREGVHLRRAYTTCPLCTPARVSLLTGRYPSMHGAYTIGVTQPHLPQPTLPSCLANAGYRTALFGKAHFVARMDEMAHIAGSPDPSPGFFETFTGPYLGFDEVRVSTGHTINAIPDGHYRVFLEQAGVSYADWFPQMGPDYNHDHVGVWNIPVDYHDSTWVGKETTDFIHRQAGAESPWFAWASFQDPHEPHVCPKEWMDRVDPARMDIPEGYREGEFADRPAFYEEAYYQGNLGSIDDEWGAPCASRRAVLETEASDALQATLGMVAGIDDQIGRILAALESSGQLENTLIIFTSDHGEYHGHHGFWGKGLPAYEDAQRVPLLIWGPGLGILPQTTNSLASLIDLPATILDFATVDFPAGMQGVSLAKLLRQEAYAVRDAVLVELRPVADFSQHTLVAGRYKLVVYESLSQGELYDLQRDPNQYTNLWNHPDHQDLRTDFLLKLSQFYQRNEGRLLPRSSFA